MNAPRIKTHTQYERELQAAKAARDGARAALEREQRERATETATLREENAALLASLAVSTAALAKANAALEIDKGLRMELGKIQRSAKAAKRGEDAVRVELDFAHAIIGELERMVRAAYEGGDELVRKARATAAAATPTPVTGIEHGTTSGYVNNGCRCAPCRAAHSKACTQQKRRRLAMVIPEDRHGVYSTYSNHGCRCSSCKAAATAYVRESRQRKLGRL